MKAALRMVAGHGGTDPGAVAGGVKEFDLNRQAVLSFNDVASKLYVPHDVTIVIYPDTDPRDGNETLLDKIAQANAGGPDQLLIEVHHNVTGPGTGAQLWYSQNAKTTAGDDTWLVMPHLARELGFLIGEPIPQLSSDHSRFGKLGILDDTTCTAILIEARNVAMVTGAEWEYSFGVALAKAMAAYFGWPDQGASVSPSLEIPIVGTWIGDPRALTAATVAMCPAALVDVAALVSIYAFQSQLAGIRADVAIAQAIHETGRFTFSGTVKADWNNFAGVGVTSAAAEQRFASPFDGVRAHLAHLRWYAYPDHGGIQWCSFPTDPRHNVLGDDGRHANTAHKVGELGGGRWAPGATYGIAVAQILDELRAGVAKWTPPAPIDDGRLAAAKQIASDAAAKIAAL